jgi:cobalt-zinc-cadmium efflux system membrane fusion protein
MNLKRLALLPAFILILVSCAAEKGTDDSHEGHDHEEHAISVTIWESGVELFTEFHAPVKGERTEFLVFLTRLEDFRPAGDGRVNVVLREGGRIAASGAAEKAEKSGIWHVEVPAVEPGDYEVAISYNGAVSAVFEAGTVTAFATEDDAAHAGPDAFTANTGHEGHDHSHEASFGGVDDHMHDENGGHAEGETPEAAAGSEDGHDHGEDVETVAFLKEQQWNTEFLIEEIHMEKMRASFPTVAEVVPRQSGFAEIVAPVEGYLQIHHNQDMAVPGLEVKPGDYLLTICPPLEGTGSWTERRFTYDRAKKEFERAERLIAREAISQREYDEIRKTWLVEKASFEAITQGVSVETAADSETGEVHLVLGSPVGGIVASVNVMPGQTITAGQQLMTIVDPSVVWLRADMFEKDYYRMGTPHGAELLIPGMEATIRIEEADLKLLSKGGVFDRASMTIPVIFEIENTGDLLKIGQVIQMDIYTSEEMSAVAVPEKSIIDEDYARYVFVQRGGESFEKRAIKTGARSGGLVEITEGLKAGERVVTRGAYSVKLASSKSETGAAHVH